MDWLVHSCATFRSRPIGSLFNHHEERNTMSTISQQVGKWHAGSATSHRRHGDHHHSFNHCCWRRGRGLLRGTTFEPKPAHESGSDSRRSLVRTLGVGPRSAVDGPNETSTGVRRRQGFVLSLSIEAVTELARYGDAGHV